MTTFRTIIENAIAEAMSEHPKYFTPKGIEHARAAIARKIMAALRDGGQAKSAEQVVLPVPPVPGLVDPESREARAYRNLRLAACAVSAPRAGDGRIIVNREALCPAALAFAECPAQDTWHFLTDRRQIGAWKEFFRETLPDVSRRRLDVVRDGQTGILMPWPWPPTIDGKTGQCDEGGMAA